MDQVGIDLVVIREGADAEQAIFRLENNPDVVGHIVRHQRGDADAKVPIKAVLHLASGLGRHLLACPDHQALASSRGRVVDRTGTRLNSSHYVASRMTSSAR